MDEFFDKGMSHPPSSRPLITRRPLFCPEKRHLDMSKCHRTVGWSICGTALTFAGRTQSAFSAKHVDHIG